MKMKKLDANSSGIVCMCEDNRTDKFVFIPKEDIHLLRLSEDKTSYEVDDTEVTRWVFTLTLFTAVDTARGDEFCLKAHGLTTDQLVTLDREAYDEFLKTVPDCENSLCETCTSKKWHNYDTGEIACDHRCLIGG